MADQRSEELTAREKMKERARKLRERLEEIVRETIGALDDILFPAPAPVPIPIDRPSRSRGTTRHRR